MVNRQTLDGSLVNGPLALVKLLTQRVSIDSRIVEFTSSISRSSMDELTGHM